MAYAIVPDGQPRLLVTCGEAQFAGMEIVVRPSYYFSIPNPSGGAVKALGERNEWVHLC